MLRIFIQGFSPTAWLRGRQSGTRGACAAPSDCPASTSATRTDKASGSLKLYSNTFVGRLMVRARLLAYESLRVWKR